MNPLAIAAISVSATAIIGSLVAGIIAIIRVLAETRAVKTEVINNAETSAIVGKARDRKLDRIEILVDGRYGEVLQELADMKDLLAKITGKPSDIAKAEAAQTKADEQVARVVASGPPVPHHES
jgi:hypothetical protein